MIGALIARDVRRAYASGGATLVIAFFLLVATLFPFAIGPDAALLARVGGGVIWAAALLAALLPVDRLVAADLEAGVLEQLAVRGVSMAAAAAAKIVAHWIAFAPPLMLAALIAAALLDLDAAVLLRVELGLAIGTPGLAALAVATGALIAGLRGASAVAGLVMLPLAVPLLIFGAGAIESGAGALKLLAAVVLLLVAGAPLRRRGRDPRRHGLADQVGSVSSPTTASTGRLADTAICFGARSPTWIRTPATGDRRDATGVVADASASATLATAAARAPQPPRWIVTPAISSCSAPMVPSTGVRNTSAPSVETGDGSMPA